MISPGDIAKAALWVAEYEGPYHVSAGDPGGATAYGISLRYNSADFTDAQLQAISPESAAQFFIKRYCPKGAEALPSYLATPLMAFSVLEGPELAVKTLQRALGIKADGYIGPETAAESGKPAPKALLIAYFRECMERLHGRPDWSTNGIGWECRQMAASLEGV